MCIESRQRQGKQNSGYGLIDNLTYAYSGNQLLKVTDAVTSGPTYTGAFNFTDGANVATEYIYDTNGSLVQDFNKKIAKIEYNTLHLPDKLQFTYGHLTDYLYDAEGVKLSVTFTTAKTNLLVPMGSIVTVSAANTGATLTTDYCGNMVYENGTLVRMLTEEGYATLSGTTPTYHYYLKDHEGNNRVVLKQDGTVEQANHYYPFGGLFGENTGDNIQPYKYNGKELDRMHGLDLFDYGARHYDAAIGRWMTVDPMAEKYYSISPYVYGLNNPVKYVDPDGRFVGTIIGTIIGGFKGAYDAHKVGKDILAGASKGAVAGVITGAAVDITAATIATGGGALAVIGVGITAGANGGALGAVAGDIAGQVVTDIRLDVGFNDAINNISTDNFARKAANGVVSGAVSGMTGGSLSVVNDPPQAKPLFSFILLIGEMDVFFFQDPERIFFQHPIL